MDSVFEEEDYLIYPLQDNRFPNPRFMSDEGLLAYGGSLDSDTILTAYKSGIFPWYSPEDPILWWSPNPRLVLYPENFKVRKSFARVLRNSQFNVKFDTAFKEVINSCAAIKREGQDHTWIVPDMIKAFMRLHEEGFAHSVEVYLDDELVGGLYGMAIGKAFFGESMFSLKSDASKIAFKALSDVLGNRGYDFIDCQMKTDHMVSLGAQVVPRDIFLDELHDTILKPTDLGSWQDFIWEYEDGK